jgi:hypothetical protein
LKSRIPYFSALALTVLVAFTTLLGVAQLAPFTLLYRYGYYANVAGYVALVLIAATGVIMLFRKQLLGYLKDPQLLRAIHVAVAGIGGGFLVFHVVFFLLFPLSLPVLFGYLATYTALAVWISGAFFLEGLRGSLFYHGLLSLIGISLMVVHVFSTQRGLSDAFSGAVLVLIACSVLAIAVKRLVDASGARTRHRVA